MEEISDRTIVLRDGQVVVSGLTRDIPRSEILRNMIGGEVVKLDESTDKGFGEVVFKAEGGLTSGKAPVDVSFQLHKGEIVGLWGLMGSGHTELIQTLYGLKKADKGRVYIDTGHGLRHVSFKRVREYCGYVTEARHDDGLFLPWPVWKNITSPNLKAYRGKPLPFLDYKKQRGGRGGVRQKS